MQFEFPVTWLRQKLPETMQIALKEICDDPVVAVTAYVSDLSADLTDQCSYLIKQDQGLESLHWLALEQNLKRRIAYGAMEIAMTSHDGSALQQQCTPLFRKQYMDDLDPDIYQVFLTPWAITVINDTVLRDIFDGDLSDLTQEDIDQVFLTLAIQPEQASSHGLLLVQKNIDKLHDILISHLIPEEIDISAARLTPLMHI